MSYLLFAWSCGGETTTLATRAYDRKVEGIEGGEVRLALRVACVALPVENIGINRMGSGSLESSALIFVFQNVRHTKGASLDSSSNALLSLSLTNRTATADAASPSRSSFYSSSSLEETFSSIGPRQHAIAMYFLNPKQHAIAMYSKTTCNSHVLLKPDNL